jgi:excisionase family DNA binding protein
MSVANNAFDAVISEFSKAFLEEFRAVVREEIATALASQKKTAEKQWLRASDLAELYGLPKTWFEERGREGVIARAKPGRYVLFKRSDVDAFLENAKKSDETA